MKTVLLFLIVVHSVCLSAQTNITWEASFDIANNTYGNLHPRMTLDGAGNPLVIWGRSGDESVFFSRWTGSAFTTPVKLNGTLTIATATWMGPDIASHGDTVYVVMKETPEADTSSHIYLVRSFDGGQNFSPPTRVDFIADSISRFPTVTTDANGNPIIAFMKFNSAFLDSRWVVLTSNDYGGTFSSDVKASGWGGSAAVCDCCPGAVVSAGNTTAMLYRNNNSNIRDIWVGISKDNGSTFTNGLNVDYNNWLLLSCPSSGPDGIVIEDTLYSVFLNGASGKNLCYLSKTSLSSTTWESTQNLTNNIAGLSQQNYPRIASSGKAVGIVWKQAVNGSSELPILFTSDIAKGFPANYDIVDRDNITNADIAMYHGRIAVCWEDDNSGVIKFRFGTFTPTTTGTIDDYTQDQLKIYPNPASGNVTIQTSYSLIGKPFYIYDFSGKVITSGTIVSKHTTVALENLPSGIYQLKIGDSNQPFIILKK